CCWCWCTSTTARAARRWRCCWSPLSSWCTRPADHHLKKGVLIMLGFLFGSTMFLVMLGSLALMLAVKRHRKYRKVTKWLVFVFALMAGSAAALCFVGEWAGGLLTGLVTYMLGAPAGAGGL